MSFKLEVALLVSDSDFAVHQPPSACFPKNRECKSFHRNLNQSLSAAHILDLHLVGVSSLWTHPLGRSKDSFLVVPPFSFWEVEGEHLPVCQRPQR